jgi:hypothetical protein
VKVISLAYLFYLTDLAQRRCIMTSPFKSNVLKFAVISAALVAAPMVHATCANNYVRNSAFEEYSGTHAPASVVWQPRESVDTYVRNTAFEEFSGTHASANVASLPSQSGKAYVHNTAFEEFSGTHATARPTTSGMAGKAGDIGEPGSAGMKRDAGPDGNMLDSNRSAPGGCRR